MPAPCRRYWMIFTLLVCPSAFALKWQLESKLSASTVEYEVARDPSFAPNSLVDQGYAQGTKLSGDLPAGLYFVRFRGQGTDGKLSEWSAPQEVLLSSRGSTEFIEPVHNARIESPTSRTPVAFRWKKVEGASLYVVEIKKPGDQRNGKSKAPFFSTSLPYGTWQALVHVYFGKKLIFSSAPINFAIEPTTQAGAEFVKPQNDDVLQANLKSLVALRRAYTPIASTFVIQELSEKKEAYRHSIKLGNNELEFFMPALPSGSYQLSVIDQLNAESSVESNIRIQSESDPFLKKAGGIETVVELNLGLLAGTRYQSNNLTGNTRLGHKGGISGPRVIGLGRSGFFDPYFIEGQLEILPSKFHAPFNGTITYDPSRHSEVLTSLSLLYRLPWPSDANPLFARAGFFGKRYKEFEEFEEIPVTSLGFVTGADWEWITWSSKWSSRFSLRVYIPFTSMPPAFEASAVLRKPISDYMYFTVNPEFKFERWNRKPAGSAESSVHYTKGWGLQIGLGLEI